MSQDYDRLEGLYWVRRDWQRQPEPAKFCYGGEYTPDRYWQVMGDNDYLHDDCFVWISSYQISIPLNNSHV